MTTQTLRNCTTKDCQQGITLLSSLHQESDPIICYLKPSAITNICRLLVDLSSLKNNDLTQQAYEILLVVFKKSKSDEKKSISANNCAHLLQSLMEATPPHSDTKLPSLFVKVLSRGFIMLAHTAKTLSKFMELIDALLPQYFSLLLGAYFQNEESLANATAKQMKYVIYECITREMIDDAAIEKQKEHNMSDNDSDENEYERGGSSLNKIISSFLEALNIKNKNNLDIVLTLLGDLFQRLGKKSYSLLKEAVLVLDRLHSSAKDYQLMSSLEKAIGAAISAMGPENLLKLVPLNITRQADGPVRGWLFSLLKDHIQNTQLQFFIDYFMPLAQQFLDRAQREEPNSEFGKGLLALVDQIWALLPGFCTYPVDFTKSFKAIASGLGAQLMQGNHVNVICTALLRLIQRNRALVKSGRIPDGVDVDVTRAQQVLDGMAKYSKNFLPILFNLYTGEQQHDVHKDIVARTVNAFCQITPSETVDEYFKQVLRRLLSLTTDATPNDQENKEKIQRKYTLTDLSLSMITSNLTPKALELLYKFILPQLSLKHDHTTQKKSYRAFYLISQAAPEFFHEHLTEILSHFKESLSALHPSAKKYRIRCLCHVIASSVIIDSYETLAPYIPQLLAEGILNSREVNAQTQEYSSQMLRAILDRICEVDKHNSEKGDEDDADSIEDKDDQDDNAAFVVPKHLTPHQQERLCTFFKNMTSGLGGSSDAMISATINVLSTMVHDYGDFIETIIPDLINAVFLLIDYNSRDVILSVIQFVKMALGLLDAEFLKQYMPAVLHGMLQQSGQKGAGVIRTRVKYLLEKMLKKFGYDYIASIWPSTEKISYLNNLNKQSRRKGIEGRRIVKAKRSLSKGGDVLNNNSIEDGIQQTGGEVLDLMDPDMINRVKSKKVDKMKDDDEEDIKIEVNKSGKIVIRDIDDEHDSNQDKKKQVKKSVDKKQQSKKRSREVADENLVMDDYDKEDEDTNDEKEDASIEKYSKRSRADDLGRSFTAQRYLKQKEQERQQKRRKESKTNAQLGTDYRAKRPGVGGDMKQKGKDDPYAYVPLQSSRLNRRNRNKPSDFDQIAKGSKKEASRGRNKKY